MTHATAMHVAILMNLKAVPAIDILIKSLTKAKQFQHSRKLEEPI